MTIKYISGGKDSLVKVIDIYFAAVTKNPFTFNGKEYKPLTLHVSPTVLRDFICHSSCGACCRDFSLDWLPFEIRPYEVPERKVEINGKEYVVYTDLNNDDIKDKQGKIRCRNLNSEGRCGIHMKHPLSCDFELLRFRKFEDHWMLGHQPFGRGWNMKRIDGLVGARCEFLPGSEEGRSSTIRKLLRLKEYTDYFGLETYIDQIVDWVKGIPLTQKAPLIINPKVTSLGLPLI